MEHHGRGGVVEEGRPKAGGIDELPRMVDGQRMLFHEHEGRSHGGKDAAEDADHLEDGRPGEVVVLSHLSPGRHHRQHDDGQEGPLTQQAQVPGRVGSPHLRDVGLVDEHGAGDDTQQPHDVDEARDRDGRPLTMVGRKQMPGLLSVVVVVDNPIDGQEQRAGGQPLGQHVHEPAEGGTLLEQQEEWWVAQRSEQSAAVGHDGDEEHDGVGLVLALADGLQEQSDEQHGRPRGAHERGQHPAQGQDEGVGRGRGLEVAPNAYAPRRHEQGHQQQDEGHVVVNHLVLQLMAHAVEAQPQAHGHAQQEGNNEFVEIVLPPLLELREWQHGNTQELHRKGDEHPDRYNVCHKANSVKSRAKVTAIMRKKQIKTTFLAPNSPQNSAPPGPL